jgi:hypothetical protein
VERWLETVGIRRAVLLAVGSAGLAAVAVAGFGLDRLDAVDAASRASADAASSVADAGALRELFWQARYEALAEAAAADDAEATTHRSRFATASRRIARTVAAYRSDHLTAAERAALTGFGRAWQRFLDAGPQARQDSPAGPAAASAVQTLQEAARAAASDAAARAERTAGRTHALAVLALLVGLALATALARLVAATVLVRGRVLVEGLLGVLRADPAAEPPPATADAGPTGDLARRGAEAAEAIRATTGRLRQARCPLPGARVPVPDRSDGERWWLQPGS